MGEGGLVFGKIKKIKIKKGDKHVMLHNIWQFYIVTFFTLEG